MYIHSYQIHNVLNVYRKQLSQGPSVKSQKHPPVPHNGDRVELTNNGQRQSIIDQVSAEIVDRIAQVGPQKLFEEALAQHMERTPGREDSRGYKYKKEAEFTYTTIDENDDKITNTLPVENFSPLTGEVTKKAQKAADAMLRR